MPTFNYDGRHFVIPEFLYEYMDIILNQNQNQKISYTNALVVMGIELICLGLVDNLHNKGAGSLIDVTCSKFAPEFVFVFICIIYDLLNATRNTE